MIKKFFYFFFFFSLILFKTSYANNGDFYIQPSLLFQNINANTGKYTGLNPKISLGFEKKFDNRLFLATELGISTSGITINDQQKYTCGYSRYYSSFNSNSTFDIAIFPGIVLDENTLLFLRLGAAGTYFPEFDGAAGGGEIGLGIQKKLSGAWELRLEYFHTDYNSIVDENNYIVGPEPKADNIAIGLMYTF